MPKTVVIDELIVTVRIPADMSDADAEAVRRTLLGTAFMARFRAAVLAVVQAAPELARVRVSVTR